MCESFWDPTVLNGVHFSEDIMKNFNKYKKGEIVSPAIGDIHQTLNLKL